MRALLKAVIFVVLASPAGVLAVELEATGVIPRPAMVRVGSGLFVLDAQTVVLVDEATQAAGEYLAEVLAPATGFRLEVEQINATARRANTICLSRVTDTALLDPEGYRLVVDKDKVHAHAATAAGAFYACQTLRMLLPPAIFSSMKVENVAWTMPCIHITDQPRFSWRGITLDSGRHFQPKEFIKRFIDLLALHKLNVLHWKLTEDQGWRLEIRKYPKLTEVGAWRMGTEGRYGGFYTQNDIREIVAYANRRHVTIVPEVEMPGHSQAAFASYPELWCMGKPLNVSTQWGVHKPLYCAGKEETFEFLENVLTETMELFPSPVIHIGGDEAPKDYWKKCRRCQARIKAEGLKNEAELQTYFLKRIGRFLQANGRRLAGWDEIMEGGTPPNAIVGSWHGTRPAVVAARGGHDVVMLPTSHTYFDYYQSLLPGQPKANGRFIPIEKVYDFEPVPAELTPEEAKHILGAYGCVWTEYMPTVRNVEYMAFPRTSAMAEVLWSPREQRNLADFTRRLDTHFQRLDRLDVAYFVPPQVVGRWAPEQMSQEFMQLEWDVTGLVRESGLHEAIFFCDGGNHGLKIRWAALLENGREIQRDTHDAFSGHRKKDIYFLFPIDRVVPGAKYAIRASVAGDGGTDSTGQVLLRRMTPALGAFLRPVTASTPEAPDNFIVLSEFQVWADASGPEVFEELNKLYRTKGKCHSFDLYPRYDYFVWEIERMKRWVDEAETLGAFNVFCIGDDTRTAKGHLLEPAGLNPQLAHAFFQIIAYAHERGLMVAVEPHGLPAVRDEEHFIAWLDTWLGKRVPKEVRADIIKLSIEWFGAYGYNPLLADQVGAFMAACRLVNPDVIVYVDSIGGQWLKPQPFHRWLLHEFPGTIISHYLNTSQVEAFRGIGAQNMMVQINPCEAGPAAHLFLYNEKTVSALKDVVRKRVRYLSLAGVNYAYNQRNYDLFLEVVRPHLSLARDVEALRRSILPDQIKAPISREDVKAGMIGNRVRQEEAKARAAGPLPRNRAGQPAFFGQAPDGCVIQNLAALGDGIVRTVRFGGAHTSPWFSTPVQATFGLDFGHVRTIRSITVVPCLDPDEDTYLARDFRLEYRWGDRWILVPGGSFRGNSQRRIALEFPALQADAVRIVIESEADDGKGHYRACCQELEVE